MSIATETNVVLNDLIHICLDGEKGFALAAEHVTDPSLKLELMDYSLQRRDFAANLQSLVAASGEKPANSADVSADLHRAWINVKSLFTNNDRYSVLAECERGEDSAVSTYQKAIDSDIPSDYMQLVQSQASAIKRTHDRIKALRDAAKH